VEQNAPDQASNQPQRGRMTLGGGVSPRLSGKKSEPRQRRQVAPKAVVKVGQLGHAIVEG